VNNKLKKYLLVFTLFASLGLINSCSLWSNFTIYYNRFYLAEKAFEEAEEEIKLNPKVNLFQLKEEKLSSNANKSFDEVIKFSSKILQFNNDSKYVNRAIYMIAKAYYYKEMYNKAVRNFYELDKLKDDELGLSTKLWIAKSEMQMRNFSVALELLDEVKKIALATEDEEILFQAYVTEISYLVYREDFSKAINKIEELTEQNLEDEIKSTVTYELGMLYVSLENYTKAVSSFELVNEGSPTFEIEFKSKLEYAKAIKQLNKNEEAMQLFSDLRDNSKYEPYWDVIDLEIAQIELESGNTEVALEIFYSIDTGYAKNETSGIAAFMQGDIMEHIYMDYDSAKTLYDKVASKKAPNDYKKEALSKSNLLKTRKNFVDAIVTAKRGYSYLIDTTLFKSDSIAYAGYLARRDSAMQVEEEKNNTQTTPRNKRTARGTSAAINAQFHYLEDSLFTFEPKMPLVSLDSLRTQISKNKYELGNLYFSDLIVPDSAYFYYYDVIKNYSDTKYLAKAIYALGSYYLTLDDKNKADSLFKFVYENHRSDPIAKIAAVRLGINIEEVNSDPALEKYRIAEEFLDSEKYFDAIEQLKSVYKEFPESPYSSKALYSIGWIYENKLHDYDGAVVYYDSLKTKYSQTEYVRAISPKLAFYHSEKKAVQDSIARAETAIKDSINRAEKTKNSVLVSDGISNINADLKTLKVNSDSTQIFVDSLKSVSDSIKKPLNLEKDVNPVNNGKDSTSTLTPFKPTSEAENKNKK